MWPGSTIMVHAVNVVDPQAVTKRIATAGFDAIARHLSDQDTCRPCGTSSYAIKIYPFGVPLGILHELSSAIFSALMLEKPSGDNPRDALITVDSHYYGLDIDDPAPIIPAKWKQEPIEVLEALGDCIKFSSGRVTTIEAVVEECAFDALNAISTPTIAIWCAESGSSRATRYKSREVTVLGSTGLFGTVWELAEAKGDASLATRMLITKSDTYLVGVEQPAVLRDPHPTISSMESLTKAAYAEHSDPVAARNYMDTCDLAVLPLSTRTMAMELAGRLNAEKLKGIKVPTKSVF